MQLCGGKETALGNVCPGRAAIGSQLSQGWKATPTPAPVPVSEATSYLSCCPSVSGHLSLPTCWAPCSLLLTPFGPPSFSLLGSTPLGSHPGTPKAQYHTLQSPPRKSLPFTHDSLGSTKVPHCVKVRGLVGQSGFSSLPVLPAQGIRLWSGCSLGMGPRTGPQ